MLLSMEFSPYQDRREHQRERIEIQVNIWNDVVNLTGVVFDLSGGGMSVLTPRVLANNTDVKISFEIPNAATVKCDARVVWSSESRRAGLKFTDVTDDDRATLSKWVADQNLKALSAKGLV